MVDGIEYAQSGITTVARDQHYFDAGFARPPVDRQEFAHHAEGDTGFQWHVFVLDLVAGIGFLALLDKNPVAFIEIKQGAGGNGQHQTNPCGGLASHIFDVVVTHGAQDTPVCRKRLLLQSVTQAPKTCHRQVAGRRVNC